MIPDRRDDNAKIRSDAEKERQFRKWVFALIVAGAVAFLTWTWCGQILDRPNERDPHGVSHVYSKLLGEFRGETCDTIALIAIDEVRIWVRQYEAGYASEDKMIAAGQMIGLAVSDVGCQDNPIWRDFTVAALFSQ